MIQKTNRRLSREDRRQQLLDVARELVAAEGVSALTMERLAERSGVSKPVVYDHFRNSDEVCAQILLDSHRRVREAVVSATADCEALVDYIEVGVDAIFKYGRGHDLAIDLITNGYSGSPGVNAIYFKLQQQSQDALKELLMQQGLDEATAEVLGQVLFVIERYSIAQFSRQGKEALAAEVIKRALSTLLREFTPGKGVRPVTPSLLFGNDEIGVATDS